MKIKNDYQLGKRFEELDKIFKLNFKKGNKMHRRKMLLVDRIEKYEGRLWNSAFKLSNSLDRMKLYHTNIKRKY